MISKRSKPRNAERHTTIAENVNQWNLHVKDIICKMRRSDPSLFAGNIVIKEHPARVIISASEKENTFPFNFDLEGGFVDWSDGTITLTLKAEHLENPFEFGLLDPDEPVLFKLTRRKRSRRPKYFLDKGSVKRIPMVLDTEEMRTAAYDKANEILDKSQLITDEKKVSDSTVFGPIYASAFFIIADRRQNVRSLCSGRLPFDLPVVAGLSHALFNFDAVRQIILSNEFSGILKRLLSLGESGRDRLVAANFIKENKIKQKLSRMLSGKKLYNNESAEWLAAYFYELLIYESGRFMENVRQFEIARLFRLTK